MIKSPASGLAEVEEEQLSAGYHLSAAGEQKRQNGLRAEQDSSLPEEKQEQIQRQEKWTQ